MILHLQVENIQSQNSIMNLDSLLCEEDFGGGYHSDERNEIIKISPLLECDMFWEDDEIKILLSKDKENSFDCNSSVSDEYMLGVRKECLEWMMSVIDHYGFTALTAVLAVNYLDRYIFGICLQKENPWVCQLVAVACLSIAAKVEEIQVPFLLDLQVENSRYKFEAKAIQRTELQVLSTLKWKMNPVTPFSFIDHIIRRFGLMANLHLEFPRKCENLILSIITDSRLLHYPPSIIASATMIYVINEIEPCNAVHYLNQFMDVLKVTKENIDECHDLILEIMSIPRSRICQTHNHKCQFIPDDVVDAYFSSESSNNSLVMASSASSLTEPQYKKSKTQDLQIILDP